MPESRNLKCPACENNLIPFEAGAVVVDICKRGCGGIWFDKDELYRVDNKQELNGSCLANISANPNVQINNSDRYCPVCKVEKMRKHYYSPKLQTFEIDECGKCGGIWLDNKEIDAIRQTFENNEDKLSYEGSYMSALSYELIDEAEKERRANASLLDKIFYLIFGC